MRITCPTCSTQYDVDENDIAFTDQDVQCTECMTIWTQARNGEATNPRLADELSESGEEIATDAENVPDEENREVEDTASDPEEGEDATEPEDLEVPEADVDDVDEDPAEEEPEAQEEDSEENPIWKEIAELAKEARADTESENTAETAYTPPDDMPPIQSSPVIPDEVEPTVNESEEEEHPWEVAAEAEEGFSDFVWSDPSDDDANEAEKDDEPSDDDEPEFTPLTDASGGPLEEMDDNSISAAFNDQMAIEDALEDEPKPEERDITDIPVELGGPRARVPNVEALKDSVRSKSVELTKDELKEQVPARRFRRGFSLILLIFVALGAVYISRSTITEYLPVVGPYLETYATFVDLLRAKSEVLGAYVWDQMMQGYDWIIAKFFS